MPELADLLRLERRSDMPAIRPGDTVRVHVRVVEGNRERPQIFEGVVLEVKKPNAYDGCFRVRRVASHGVGVERTFMFHSPRVEKVEVSRRGAVRRAKLYYLRGLTGKAARIKERGSRRQGQGEARTATPRRDGAARSESANRSDSAARNGSAGRNGSATKAGSAARGEAATRAEAGTRAEAAARAEATTRAESAPREEAATHAESAARGEAATRAEAATLGEAATRAEAPATPQEARSSA